MSGPLSALDGVLAKIRRGEFNPDQTRSGRWTQEPARETDEVSEAPTEGRGLACTCDDPRRETSALGFKGARLFRCRHCHRAWTEVSAWTAEEQRIWGQEFPAECRTAVASDADSEPEGRREGASAARAEEDAASDVSSSDAAPQTADEEPGTEDEVAVALRAVSLLTGEQSDQSETTDEEEAWVNPMYWDFELAQHSSWYTVHAVSRPGMLLCGRVKDKSYEFVVNPRDSHPVCRICRARVRGSVEQARQIVQQENSDAQDEDEDETLGSGTPRRVASPSSSSEDRA